MPISCHNAKSDFEYIGISDLKLLAYNKLCAGLIFRGSWGEKDKWDDPHNHTVCTGAGRGRYGRQIGVMFNAHYNSYELSMINRDITLA